MTYLDKNVLSQKTINYLARNYNTLDYFVDLVALLEYAYPTRKLNHLSKFEIHKIFNDILLNNYNGEEIIKYKLFEQYFSKSTIIGAFEMKVNNSRVDFLAINGQTTSYEIKSELDNLSKLQKQTADYSLAFEYNYLIVDYSHIEKAITLIPENYGLSYYKNGICKKIKKAKMNNGIDPEIQLRLLTKRELEYLYPHENGKIKCILKSYTNSEINKHFKNILKARYKIRWNFLKENQKKILPIDLQFFFNANILPKLVYY